MAYRFTPRARDDLREIIAYIESESPVAADRLRHEISKTINLIAERPQIGVQNAKDPTLRSFLLLRHPYRVHYLVERGTVWIVHIRHSSRRPWKPSVG